MSPDFRIAEHVLHARQPGEVAHHIVGASPPSAIRLASSALEPRERNLAELAGAGDVAIEPRERFLNALRARARPSDRRRSFAATRLRHRRRHRGRIVAVVPKCYVVSRHMPLTLAHRHHHPCRHHRHLAQSPTERQAPVNMPPPELAHDRERMSLSADASRTEPWSYLNCFFSLLFRQDRCAQPRRAAERPNEVRERARINKDSRSNLPSMLIG